MGRGPSPPLLQDCGMIFQWAVLSNRQTEQTGNCGDRRWRICIINVWRKKFCTFFLCENHCYVYRVMHRNKVQSSYFFHMSSLYGHGANKNIRDPSHVPYRHSSFPSKCPTTARCGDLVTLLTEIKASLICSF